MAHHLSREESLEIVRRIPDFFCSWKLWRNGDMYIKALMVLTINFHDIGFGTERYLIWY